MDQIVWQDKYKIDVDFIDEEHKKLFSTMNRLLKISQDEEKREWGCREGVKYLKNHTIEHFEHEEGYMRSIDYSDYEIHKRLHDNFRFKTLPALEEELVNTDYSIESIRHFLGVCIGWVIAHTQTEDLAISGKSTTKWIDIPHEEEKNALEQTIVQLFNDIFHMKPKMISELYAGEYFGGVVCCRFIYRSQDKEKWEITLVYEDKLLLKIINDILDSQHSRVDDMVINVIRYLSRQFLEQVRESIPTIDLFELEKESLMTYEQLSDSFERSKPSCSMLFDAGEGYFAFCISSSDSIQGRISSSITPDNVLTAVSDYLKKENTDQKKKILIVDDSDFMRKRIIQLLSDSYELVEAGSSISALKIITTAPPDLVLMDYEMPVCDGRQTLEMMRSDQDTAKIPVIFLTGKGDRESVSKVMSLKPEGYLLKTMPDQDIKQNIHDFFAKSKTAEQ